MLKNEEVIVTLNGLIETCKDGQQGFQVAADGVSDPVIGKAFREYSNQRSLFAMELQGMVHDLGGAPETTGSVAEAFRRGWNNISEAVTGRNEVHVLKECVRGEEAAISNYRHALERILPAPIEAVVHAQYDKILAAHDQVLSFRIVIASPSRT